MKANCTKTLVAGGTLAAALVFGNAPVLAADFPTRPITMVFNTAGGSSGPLVQLLEQKINERQKVGIRFLAEIRPGASGNIATAYVAQAKPDGYTLLWTNCALSIAPGVFKSLPYDPLKDLEPIALANKALQVLVAAKSFPADNLPDFLKHVKANPNKYFYGSVGIGSIGNLGGEELKIATGIDLTHVPFPGSPDLLRGMLTGDLQTAILSPAAVLPLINAGTIKPIAVLSPERTPFLPNTPAALEFLPGFQGRVCWNGTLAPAGTPKEIIDILHRFIDDALQDPEMVKSMNNVGLQPMHTTVEEFRARLREEVPAYRAISKEARISID